MSPKTVWHPISETQFREALKETLATFMQDTPTCDHPNFVTGPGRSGAITAVYTSHILNIPFVPHKQSINREGNLLIIDTVSYTGKTLAKSLSWYNRNSRFELIHDLFVFPESRSNYYKFWYES